MYCDIDDISVTVCNKRNTAEQQIYLCQPCDSSLQPAGLRKAKADRKGIRGKEGGVQRGENWGRGRVSAFTAVFFPSPNSPGFPLWHHGTSWNYQKMRDRKLYPVCGRTECAPTVCLSLHNGCLPKRNISGGRESRLSHGMILEER